MQVFNSSEEHPGDKRIQAIYFDSANECLLTGSNMLEQWPLARAAQDVLQQPHTHERPLLLCMQNPAFAQVCSTYVLYIHVLYY